MLNIDAPNIYEISKATGINLNRTTWIRDTKVELSPNGDGYRLELTSRHQITASEARKITRPKPPKIGGRRPSGERLQYEEAPANRDRYTIAKGNGGWYIAHHAVVISESHASHTDAINWLTQNH